jgi:TusE/DsrC/DsvC family sulfur relay protein
MAQTVLGGVTVDLSDDGYMTDPSQWNEEVAQEISKEEGIELTEKHFEVINFLREKYTAGEQLTIRKVGKSGIVDIKGLYDLFPGGPLKKSSRIAGIPKPSSCV